MFLSHISRTRPRSIHLRRFSSEPMSAIVSQLFNLKVEPGFSLQSAAFTRLRMIARLGGANEQYYGFDKGPSDRLCWIIRMDIVSVLMQLAPNSFTEWPKHVNPANFNVDGFRESVNALDVNKAPQSWLVPFDSADLPRPGLTAPLTEFVSVTLNQFRCHIQISSRRACMFRPQRHPKRMPSLCTKRSLIAMTHRMADS